MNLKAATCFPNGCASLVVHPTALLKLLTSLKENGLMRMNECWLLDVNKMKIILDLMHKKSDFDILHGLFTHAQAPKEQKAQQNTDENSHVLCLDLNCTSAD